MPLLKLFTNTFLLLFDKIWTRFDQSYVNVAKLVCELRNSPDHVSHHEAGTWSHLDDTEPSATLDSTKVVLHSGDHPNAKRFAKHLRDLRRSREVSTLVEDLVFRRVVAVFWVVKAELHEASEVHWNVAAQLQLSLNDVF